MRRKGAPGRPCVRIHGELFIIIIIIIGFWSPKRALIGLALGLFVFLPNILLSGFELRITPT